MAFDPIPVGTRLSSGARIGRRVGVFTYAIEYPATPPTPSAGSFPKAPPSVGNGNGGPMVVVAGGPCGNGAVSPQSAASMARGAAKRPDFGPVVAFTSQTLPQGFKADVGAFGLVVPEGR